MNEIESSGMNDVPKELIDHIVSVSLCTIEAQIDHLVAKCVARYMNLPLTVDMVADVLRVNRKTIYKWHDRGKLTFSKENGRMIITIQELNKQLSNTMASKVCSDQLFYPSVLNQNPAYEQQ